MPYFVTSEEPGGALASAYADAKAAIADMDKGA